MSKKKVKQSERTEEDTQAAVLSGEAMAKVAPIGAKPEKDYNIFKCMGCEGEPEFDFDGLKVHLQAVHTVDTATAPVKRQMVMHMDGADYYMSTYKLEIDGIVIYNEQYNVRVADDWMRFA